MITTHQSELRENLLEAAQREMVAFERREREFKRRVKLEEAEELHLPIVLAERH